MINKPSPGVLSSGLGICVTDSRHAQSCLAVWTAESSELFGANHSYGLKAWPSRLDRCWTGPGSAVAVTHPSPTPLASSLTLGRPCGPWERLRRLGQAALGLTPAPLPCSYESWSVCASTPTPTRGPTSGTCTRLPSRCTCGLQAPERGADGPSAEPAPLCPESPLRSGRRQPSHLSPEAPAGPPGAGFTAGADCGAAGGGALVTLLVVKSKTSFFKLLWTISVGLTRARGSASQRHAPVL